MLGSSGARFIRRTEPALSLDPATKRFESGMLSLVQQLGSLLRGMLTWCGPWLTPLMGTTSSLDPPTAPFESGMPRLALQLAILSRGTPTRCYPLPTLPMGAASPPD